MPYFARVLKTLKLSYSLRNAPSIIAAEDSPVDPAFERNLTAYKTHIKEKLSDRFAKELELRADFGEEAEELIEKMLLARKRKIAKEWESEEVGEV